MVQEGGGAGRRRRSRAVEEGAGQLRGEEAVAGVVRRSVWNPAITNSRHHGYGKTPHDLTPLWVAVLKTSLPARLAFTAAKPVRCTPWSRTCRRFRRTSPRARSVAPQSRLPAFAPRGPQVP